MIVANLVARETQNDEVLLFILVVEFLQTFNDVTNITCQNLVYYVTSANDCTYPCTEE